MKATLIDLAVFVVLVSSFAALGVTAVPDATRELKELGALMTEGRLEADLGNFEAAAEAFAAVAADAWVVPEQRWEALVRLGLAENVRGDFRGGAAAFRKVTAEYSDDPRAIEFLTRAVAGTAPGKIWVALEPQFEELLASAEVVSTGDLLMGFSGPKRVHLAQDDIELRGVFKSRILSKDPADRGEYEVAAYEMDKILGLHMVPPVVERVIDGQKGSLQLWVEGCETLDKSEGVWRDVMNAERERSRLQTFDSVIGNRHRYRNQLLVAPAGDLILIDHTRTFGNSGEIVDPPDRFDRQLVQRLRALDRQKLTDRLSHLLSDVQIEAILDRRDALLAHLDQIVAERGETHALF